ncbi:MAG: PAQR family membrane homeostasis protein TrhA [Selenomonadaceae bacterium]
MQAITMKARWRLEEILNAVTHGIGTALAVAALTAMLLLYYNDGVYHLTSCLIYGGSLILLYLASTLYHSFSNERVKAVFKFIDHAAIYVVIAGSYTPFTLLALPGSFGWKIFCFVWLLACAGIVFQLFCVKRFRMLGTFCYLAMGWFAVVMIGPLLETLPLEAVYWLVLGGAFYTVGALFYLIRKIPYNHAIWHLFVLAGSAAHFVAVFRFVLPMPELVRQLAGLGMF